MLIKNVILIPARKGSQRLKNKNILKIKNKTLVERAITFSNKIKKIDKIIVSTDIKEILGLVKKYKNVYFHKRPKYLAKKTSLISTLVNHLNYIMGGQFINIMVLQPTSPYRSSIFINQQWLKFINLKKKYKSNVSVSIGENKEKRRFDVIDNILIDQKSKSKKKKISYQANGNFFFSDMNFIKKYNKFIISGKTTASIIRKKKNTIDIDTKKDYKKALRFSI